MPGDAKLETAVELLELYNNPEKLKAYKYTQPIVSTKGINNEKFHMDLPYQQIKWEFLIFLFLFDIKSETYYLNLDIDFLCHYRSIIRLIFDQRLLLSISVVEVEVQRGGGELTWLWW